MFEQRAVSLSKNGCDGVLHVATESQRESSSVSLSTSSFNTWLGL